MQQFRWIRAQHEHLLNEHFRSQRNRKKTSERFSIDTFTWSIDMCESTNKWKEKERKILCSTHVTKAARWISHGPSAHYPHSILNKWTRMQKIWTLLKSCELIESFMCASFSLSRFASNSHLRISSFLFASFFSCLFMLLNANSIVMETFVSICTHR